MRKVHSWEVSDLKKAAEFMDELVRLLEAFGLNTYKEKAKDAVTYITAAKEKLSDIRDEQQKDDEFKD